MGYHASIKWVGNKDTEKSMIYVIKRALVQAKIPALKEPSNLSQSGGKRPEGLTLTSWKNGRALIWDVTIADTVSPM